VLFFLLTVPSAAALSFSLPRSALLLCCLTHAVLTLSSIVQTSRTDAFKDLALADSNFTRNYATSGYAGAVYTSQASLSAARNNFNGGPVLIRCGLSRFAACFALPVF
jgi:hypothetical protein